MIPYGRQLIEEADINEVVKVLRSESLTNGPLVQRFEDQLQLFTGNPTISVSSGTAALHCAFAAIGISPGDEVITPPITFIATQATAMNFGAKIVFADIQDLTGNIDPEAVSDKITKKTRAIVAVDFAGHPCDYDELRKIAGERNIVLIEDASHSLGSTYKAQKVGTLADITTYSFFPTKNITTGEGGAVSSSNSEFLNRARKYSRQGLERDPNNFILNSDGPWHQEVQEIGLNYRLPDILCALGISQLSKLPQFKERRNEIFNYYSAELSDITGIKLPHCKPYVNPVWHLFPIRVDAAERLDFYNYMKSRGIGVQVNYFPAHKHPVFSHEHISMPKAEKFYSEEVSIPLHCNLLDSEVEYISESVKGYFKG
jgi:perosamine synthetase